MSAAHPLPTNSSRSAGKRRREFNEPPREWYAGRRDSTWLFPKCSNTEDTETDGGHGQTNQEKSRGPPSYAVNSVLVHFIEETAQAPGRAPLAQGCAPC